MFDRLLKQFLGSSRSKVIFKAFVEPENPTNVLTFFFVFVLAIQ